MFVLQYKTVYATKAFEIPIMYKLLLPNNFELINMTNIKNDPLKLLTEAETNKQSCKSFETQIN